MNLLDEIGKRLRIGANKMQKFEETVILLPRFTNQLLPLLEPASPELSRVVSFWAPGEELNFSLKKAAVHVTNMTDFAFEEAAKKDTLASFVHEFTRRVETGFFKETEAVVTLGGKFLKILASPWMVNMLRMEREICTQQRLDYIQLGTRRGGTRSRVG